MSEHINNMMQCFLLASQGSGYVSPNPLVGAMLVHNGSMIGAGYHMQYGTAHAEVNCIESVAEENKHLIAESTLYINLEPCNHTGKTPPCTVLILKHLIKKVVIANLDNNKLVNGAGIKMLEDAGVEVIQDVLKEQALAINRRFFTYHEKKRPYIILKWAQTADGFISDAPNKTLKISQPETDKLVHTWRSQEDAVVVGYNTALVDNPQLNVRHIEGRNPVRIVLDWENKLPENLNIFDNSQPTLIFNKHINGFKSANKFIKVNNLQEVINNLYQAKTLSILIEGGSKTIQQFIDADLWDEARIIASATRIGNGYLAPALKNDEYLYDEKRSTDIVHYFKNTNNIYL